MTNPNGTPTASTSGKVWADGLEINQLNSAIAANSRGGSKVTEADKRFWSTPARPASSAIKEVMQISLASPRLINHVTFSAATFPQDVYLEYWDQDQRLWLPCLDASVAQPSPAVHTILDSRPNVIPPASSIVGHYHPQHSYSGHWHTVAFKIRPITAILVRLVLQRNARGRLPTNAFGKPIDYSLAIRDFTIGFKVESRADVPRTAPREGSYSEYETFATMTDVLGSSVDFSLRVNKASNVLKNQGGHHDDESLVWKCEPQPVPWAVVNMFVDVRGADGSPQIIDRFYVDPLYDGPNVNLYWSNDEPSGAFAAVDEPLDFGVVTVHDERGVPGNVLHSGDANKDYVGYVDVDNGPFCFAPSQTWWLGGKLHLKFAHGTQNTVTPILDLGELNISITPLTFRVETVHGDTVAVRVEPFDPATPLTFFVGHDSDTHTMRIDLRVGDVFYSVSAPLSVPFSSKQPGTLRFGGLLGDSPGIANSDIDSLVLKVDDHVDDNIARDFLLDVAPFVVSGGNVDRTGNAMLRYDTTFVTPQYRSGFIGGTINRYHELAWHPIARDYALRKGFLYLPPTKARYWKWEFCGLVPEAIEVFKPIAKTVQTYPVMMWGASGGAPTLWDNLATTHPGVLASIDGVAAPTYKDTTTQIGTGGSGKLHTNTEVRVIWDDEARNNVSSVYWAWNFLPLHAAPRTPSFEQIGVHAYETTIVDHSTKLGYLVGIKSLSAYRLDYTAAEDNEQIVELFQDLNALADNTNWLLSGDHVLTSGGAHYAEAVSKVLPSQRIVRGVQFATQQSAPRQLLPDHDFIDPLHANWSAVGDAHLADTVTADVVLGSTVRVDRSLTKQQWSSIEGTFALWQDISGTTTYAEIERGTVLADNFGGVSSIAVDGPIGGRVYAAARVVADRDLVAPLRVQILDETTGIVMADSRIDVKAGKVTEWFGGFTIGELTARPWRWADFSAAQTGTAFMDQFQRANATELGTLASGQRWYTEPTATSLQIVSNKAAVTTEGQYSYIDSGSLWGRLDVIVGAMGSTTTGEVKLIEFAPLYINDKGELNHSSGMALNLGSVLTADGSARSVQASDDITIEILPTIAVPSAKMPAGVDPVVSPYALMFSLNGSWVRTICHGYGARTVRAIKGRLGQQFASVSWTPSTYGRVRGRTIYRKPQVNYGAWTGEDNRDFLDNDGTLWTTLGSWDISDTTPEIANTDSCGISLRAATNGAVIATDVGAWYGTMYAYVRNVASTATTGAKHGNVLCLDFDNGIYVSFDGDIVDSAGTHYGSLFVGGIPNNSRIAVQWARTSRLSPAQRGGQDPNQVPDMLIARVNGTVVGRFVGEQLAQWRGTRRGLAGDVYSGDSTGVSKYDANTGFRAFSWAPDASNVVVGTPTWDNVTNYGLNTYDTAPKTESSLDRPRLRVQLIQTGESTDAWEVDTLSLFVDPLVWSFSTDGGYTWYPALDVRNDPNGVLTFPDSTVVVDPAQRPGQSLVWRVVSYAPDTTVSSLVIRPWYGGALSGITHHVGVSGSGPNLMPYDQYPDIRRDSRFQTWRSPIPQDWWHSYRIRQRALQQSTGPDNNLLYPSDLLFPADNLFPL